MGKRELNNNVVPSLIGCVPACQWGFNRALRFHYICGRPAGIFRRQPEELRHQHVSMIDDPKGSWVARLDRIFSSATPYDMASPASEQGHTIIHVPIHANDGNVVLAAGFAYDAGDPTPPARELEFAALATLQALESERARTERFLHDVVAQCLSGTGLQLELLRLEIEAQKLETPGRTGEIQRSLEEALRQVRTFSSEEDAGTANEA